MKSGKRLRCGQAHIPQHCPNTTQRVIFGGNPKGTPCQSPHYLKVDVSYLNPLLWAAERWPGNLVNASGWLIVIGILIFSGSLYLVALSGARWLGAITPIGGLCFILGWITLATAALRSN